MNRPIYLSGFMGSGKTSTGRAVARLAQLPFVDLDGLIEAQAGRSIPDLFRQDGEAHFRALERRLLDEQVADETPRVIALGGGALLDRPLRLRVLRQACLVSLHADVATLLERTSDRSARPLLEGPDREARVRQLLHDRAEGYAEAHALIDTSFQPVEVVARRVVEVASLGDLALAAGARSYPVRFCSSSATATSADGLGAFIEQLRPSSLVAITDSNVAPLVMDDLRRAAGSRPLHVHVLEAGEQAKSMEGLTSSWQALQRAGLDRRGLVLGIGGGVVTDVAGFVAGTWLRGVRWLAAPTTLLGMVDAAIGGKTAIDFGPAKNVVGVFHQPSAVFIDPSRTLTEPDRSFVSGLAEVVKSALVGDADLFESLEQNAEAILQREPASLAPIVRAAAAVKVGIVSRDELDTGERMLLNLGHTLGHALEAAGGFGHWMHGEAVSLGLIAALQIGVRLGVTPVAVLTRTSILLARLGLPTRLLRNDVEQALPLLGHDKKRESDGVRFVLVDEIGRAHTRRLSLLEVSEHVLASNP